ncbi:MAG: hypothetical protein COA79_11040 [Planctomycetota bacterium]|nr:MAG: hypothetical protein COA79_11040 [Planctomycetota bacterium]
MSTLARTTSFALKTVEKIMNAKIHVHGKEFLELSKFHPAIFVVNHFTRAETFILPYVIYQESDIIPRSLADSELFVGRFGKFLTSMGALSVSHPKRNQLIIGDLMKQKNNWVIFPEGMMVKNKLIYEKGKFIAGGRDEKGRGPRTGSAVLAIKAAMYRRAYFLALEKGDEEKVKELSNMFDIKSHEEISGPAIAIIPVNITYYPIRPGANMIHKVVKKFFKDMPKRVEEELEIEGNLLMNDTDIHITFNRPYYPADYIFQENKLMKFMLKTFNADRRMNFTLWYQKNKLTTQFMGSVYDSVTINIDHVFCAILRALNVSEINKKELFLRVYYTITEIWSLNKNLHPTLKNDDLIKIITTEAYEPLNDIFNLAVNEGTITVDGDLLQLRREDMINRHRFHNIRLKNTMRVIANEIEPLRDVIRVIKRVAKMKFLTLREKIPALICRLDQELFEKDYETYYEKELSRPKEIGAPYLLNGENLKYGVVLSHGYLSAPEEVRYLAEYINSKFGIPVYVIRLKGHGTAPKNLANVEWEDWCRSYLRGVAIIRNMCEKPIFGGFSSGGLVSLINTSLPELNPIGTFSINAPLRLKNLKTKLVPAVSLWNELLGLLRIDSGKFEFVANDTESPDVNYTQNYLKGVMQLGEMMEACEDSLKDIKSPVLIIQGDNDPTVSPDSGNLINDALGSSIKHLRILPFDRHVIVRKERREEVFEVVEEFILELMNNS